MTTNVLLCLLVFLPWNCCGELSRFNRTDCSAQHSARHAMKRAVAELEQDYDQFSELVEELLFERNKKTDQLKRDTENKLLLKDDDLRGSFSSTPQQILTASSLIIFDSVAYHCIDVTHDGQILLGSANNGIVQFNASGHFVGGVLIPLRDLYTIAVLRDGRVGATFVNQRTLMLLKQKVSRTGDSRFIPWSEDLRLDNLPLRTGHFSVHDDVMVYTEQIYNMLSRRFSYSRRMELINISSEALIGTLNRQYLIHGVLITAKTIISVGTHPESLGNGGNALVIYAHSRKTDQLLWRYQISAKEGFIRNIISDPEDRLLYILLVIHGKWDARVAIISLRDGRELRRYVVYHNRFAGLYAMSIAMGNLHEQKVIAVLYTLFAESTSAVSIVHWNDDE